MMTNEKQEEADQNQRKSIMRKREKFIFFSFLQKEKRIKKKTKWEMGGMGSGTKSIKRMKRRRILYASPSGQEKWFKFQIGMT